MKNRVLTLVIGLILGVSLSACGRAPMTDAQLASVLSSLASTTGSVGSSVQAFEQFNEFKTLHDEDFQPFTAGTTTLSTTLNCSKGGTAVVTGALTTAPTTTSSTTKTTTFTLDFAQTLTNCAHTASDGKDYTVSGTMTVTGATGTSTITATGSLTTLGIDSTFTLPVKATITATGGDLSVNNCSIEMTATTKISGTVSTLGYTYSWDGTVCGASMKGSLANTSL